MLVGTDDDDPPGEPAIGTHAVEDLAGDAPLEHQHHRRQHGGEEHPQPGERVELDGEGDEQHAGDEPGHRRDDVARLLALTLVRP